MVSPQVQVERPPHINFEQRAIEDRNATIEQGHYVAVDIDFVIITPLGSKDRIERNAKEWFEQLEVQAANGQYNPEWVDGFKTKFELYKKGLAIPVEGTSIKGWPVLSPAEITNCLSVGIYVVEDLAVANEQTVSRLGMGGRLLKQRAVDYLAAAKNTGVSVTQLEALRVKIEALEARNLELETRVKAAETSNPTAAKKASVERTL